MAQVIVNLTDTFEQWRVKTNLNGAAQGDLATLSTTAKNSLVAAINEIYSNDSDDMENVVDDTSPQLGGNLDLNSKDVTGTGNINTTGAPTVSGILTGASIAGTVVCSDGVTATTQTASNNSTKLATTAYVDAQVATEDTLAEMNDTTMSGLANLDVLQYTGSAWENKTLAAAGIPTKGFTVAMAVALG